MTDPSTSDATQSCPLTWPQQRWNLILFALCTGTQYLAAPVLYVGITQASLCNRLGADTRTANLPGTLFFAMTAMPALIAWISPQVSALKRNLWLCYSTSALMLASLAMTLALPVSDELKLFMVILQGGVSGAVMPAAIAFLWEVMGRGSDESRRGLALGLAFGAAPLLAVLGSIGQMALLGGTLDLYFIRMTFEKLAYPTGFIVLFAAGAPIMGLAAALSQFFIIAPVDREPVREPASSVIGLLVGLPLMLSSVALMHFSGHLPASIASFPLLVESLQALGYLTGIGAAAAFIFHFRSILQQRVLFLATLVTILVYAGNVIPSNMNLYSAEVLGNAPADSSGIQLVLRFTFKMITGAFLGWALTRTSPRFGILATSTIFLLAMIWAMFVTGPWYLVAFGIHGAGELIGVYAPNYIVSASRRDQLRQNMALVTMLMVPAAPAGNLYGAIVDTVQKSGWTAFGLNSTALGFRLSFFVCGCLILSGIILAIIMLPSKPRPEPPVTETA